MPYNVAIVGATGNTGSETIKILQDQVGDIGNIYPLASQDSVGKPLLFKGSILKVGYLGDFDFAKVDVAIFAAGSKVAAKYIPQAINKGCTVIDKSSYFRMQSDVSLIVPEVNGHLLANKKGKIISSPNCVAAPLALILKPLHDNFAVQKAYVSTYQSVSGAGKNGTNELYNQTQDVYSIKPLRSQTFTKQIAFNLLPQIGDVEENLFTSEENKIALEVQKILDAQIDMAVTCVRVPVFIGHSMVLNIEFDKETTVEDVTKTLKSSKGIVVSENHEWISPVEATGKDSVFVSRIRKNPVYGNSFSLWIVCDNLRKGAALNTVQILQKLLKYDAMVSS